MHTAALDILDEVGGFATTNQLLTVMTRQQLDVQVRRGGLVRVWHGVYAATPPSMMGRLAALDVFMGNEAVACLGTAAALYGFDVENTSAIHVFDPGVRMRPTVGLMVHQEPAPRSAASPAGSQPRRHGLRWRSRGSYPDHGLWRLWMPACTRHGVRTRT
jgi:hypothetical protein